MMNEVAKRAGLSVTYRVFETWADLVAALERADADLVPAVAVTQAREGRMLFTRPLVTSRVSVFVRQDTDDVRGWSDLSGRRAAVIEGGNPRSARSSTSCSITSPTTKAPRFSNGSPVIPAGCSTSRPPPAPGSTQSRPSSGRCPPSSPAWRLSLRRRSPRRHQAIP